MEICKLKFNIKQTEGQKIAWELCHDKKNRVVVLCFSRQSGKTVLAEMLLIEHLLKKGNYNVYISPTFQLGRKVYKEIVQLLEPTHLIKKANSSTLTIETIFGSTLQFFSSEAYTSIRGTTCKGVCIIDEAAYIQDVMPNGENFWGNIVMPITKARSPKVIMISTPCGKQGFFHEYYLRALNNEDGITQLTRTIYQDNLVEKEQIEEIKRSIPAKAFKQEFECCFLSSSISYFENFEDAFKDFIYQPYKEYIGIDISGNGSDDTIVSKVNQDNEVEIIKIDGTLDVKYKKIADILNSSKAEIVYMENNGIGLPFINEVKKLVKNKRIEEWTTTNSSKEEIISSMAVKIANKEVWFNKKDTELFSQLSTFVYKISKTKKLTFAAQEGKKDDMVLATAIALRAKDDFGTKFTQNLGLILKV